MFNMVNILTLLSDSGRFRIQDVINLYEGIKNNTKKPIKFYCYTNKTIKHNGINTIKIDDPNYLKGIACTNGNQYKTFFPQPVFKLNFHKENFANIKSGEKCLIMDLDIKIRSCLDEIFDLDLDYNSLYLFEKVWKDIKEKTSLHAGVQFFRSGVTKDLYEKYKQFKREDVRFGEQSFFFYHCPKTIKFKLLPKEWLYLDCKSKKQNVERVLKLTDQVKFVHSVRE